MSEKYFTPEDLEAFYGVAQTEAFELTFAQYLADYREKRSGIYRPCSISATPPEVDSGYVRLPHLVAFQDNAVVHDEVMWEKLSCEHAEQWLGSELPNQQLIEDHLSDLKILRAQVRTNQLQDEKYDDLKKRLVGRYLSILFVYQNIDLFESMWGG